MRLRAWHCCLLLLFIASGVSWAVNPVPLVKEQFHVIGNVFTTVPLPNGQVLIGGDFETVNGFRQPHAARLNADGTLDQSWRPQVSRADQMVVAGDDVYFLNRSLGSSDLQRAKLSDDGRIDSRWAVKPQDDTILDVAISGDFAYVLSYHFSPGPRLVLKRYFRAGTGKLDRSWSTVVGVGILSVGLLADERHVYVAHGPNPNHKAPTYLDRYPVAGRGARDRHWRAVIRQPGGAVLPLAQDDRFVYLGGSGMSVGRPHTVSVARFSKETAKCDLEWPSDQVTSENEYADVAVYDGTAFLLARDRLTAVPAGPENPQGAATYSVPLPQDFNQTVPAALRPYYVYHTLSVGNHALYVVPNPPGTQDRILRIDVAGGALDQGFHPRIYRDTAAVIKQVLRLPNGTTFVAGRFDALGEVPQVDLARFEPDGTFNAAWAPRLSGGGIEKIYVAGDSVYTFDGDQLQKISLATPALVDSVWNPRGRLDATLASLESGYVPEVEFTSNGAYVVYNRYKRSTGITGVKLYRIPLFGDGTPDPSWDAKLDIRYSHGLFAHQGFLYVAGSVVDRYPLIGNGARDPNFQIQDFFGTLGGDESYLYIAAYPGLQRYPLSGTGAADQNWTLRFDFYPNSLLKAGPWLYASGGFDKVNGVEHKNVVRIDANGAADPNFTPNVPFLQDTAGPRWVGALGESPILGGTFDEIDGATAFPPTLLTSLTPPSLTRSSARVFADFADAEAIGVGFVRVTALQGGTLATSDGVPVNVGDFVTLSQGRAGLDFTPGPSGPRSLSLASAFSTTDADTGAVSSTIDLTETVPPKNQYSMAAATLSVREGTATAMVSVKKVGPNPGGVTFTLEDGAARLGANYSAPTSMTLNFPTGDGTAVIAVPLIDDGLFTGNKDFRVILGAPTDDGLVLTPAATQVTIVDDDPIGDTNSLTTRPVLVASPAGSATLTVNLNAALGAWRLLGEAIWHGSGDTLTGLTRGNYFVEFRIANGFIAPPARTVPVDFDENVTVDGDYLPLATETLGALSVFIQPASVASDAGAARGQWKLVGETDWRDSGDTVEDLPAGPYDVVFKSVPGRQTPPLQTVNVAGAVVYSVTGTYLIADSAAGAQPQPVDFVTQQTAPYGYVGQIRTPFGFASGTAVRDRVVLTAAHALFDDATLSAVTDARWYFQKARGNFEPPPQGARGWYIFAGYASQRASDLQGGAGGIGISTPESQQLDLAAMWFLEPCARGSFAGYLRSDASNDWLLASRRRILAGYPIDEVAEESRGKLHATDPDAVSTFTAPNAVVRASPDLKGSEGMSGGPLFVEDNGVFYPAGVFLGGTGQSLVRVIDADAVDLINRGEVSGNGGDNNVGGGVTLVTPGITTSPFAPTLLSCTLSPAGAVAQGAAWRIAGEQSYHATGAHLAVNPGTYRLEFKRVNGFVAPATRVVNLVQGQVATARDSYLPGVAVSTIVDPPGAGMAPGGDFPLGQQGSLTAKPGPQFIFSAWMENGQVVSRNATFSFDVNGPRQFTALFVEGSFVPFTGTYAGLHQTAGVADGLATFTLTGNGSFTGKVSYRGRTYSVRGMLQDDGAFSGALGSFPLLLTLDRSTPVGVLTGQIFDGSTTNTFTATQSPYTAAHPTTLAGSYTLLLPSANPSDATTPPGTGAASVKVTASGAVSFSGTLADGVPFSGASTLIDGNVWPLYATTFGGAGGVTGLVRFREVPGVSDADGSLHWLRPPARSDHLYPSGFETTLPAVVSTYEPPPLNFVGASLQLSGGNIASPVTRVVTVNTSHTTITSADDKLLRLTINPRTGLISGNLTNPSNAKKVSATGAVFQATRRAAGFVKTSQPQTSALEIVPGT